jgi:hypothetical protein
MGAAVITTGSQVQCPHGGRAVLTTANHRLGARSGHVLLERDVHLVSGCPFTVGTTPSPCVRIEWQAPATRVAAAGTQVLLETSVGVCVNAGNAPQGVAQVVQAEPQVAAR